MGSATEILSMQKREEQRMIDGILKHNFENFWEINQPLCDKNIGDVKKYAIRIFCNRHHTYVQPNIDVRNALTNAGGEVRISLDHLFARMSKCQSHHKPIL